MSLNQRLRCWPKVRGRHGVLSDSWSYSGRVTQQ